MKTPYVLAIILTLGLALGSGDAEAAKRLGAGKSSGMQRQSTSMDKAAPTSPASPAAPANIAKGSGRGTRT